MGVKPPPWASALDRGRAEIYRWSKAFRGEGGRYRYVRDAERIARLDRTELDALQLRRLRHLLAYAGAKVPYYRDLFAAQGFDPRASGTMAGCSSPGRTTLIQPDRMSHTTSPPQPSGRP